jgi:hypothetical protein
MDKSSWTLHELDVLVSAWRDSEAGGDLLRTILMATEVSDLALDRRCDAILDALDAGITWDEIAAALNMDRVEAYVTLAPLGAGPLPGWNDDPPPSDRLTQRPH